MTRMLPNVTDAEWAVLQLLWDKGPATVRRLTEVLYPRGGASEYATVHKLLERLETKGYVLRGRNGGVYVFRAAIDRDAVIGQQLETLVDKMCGGSLQPLLSNLVRAKRLKPAELRELLELVDRLDTRAKGKKDRGS
jgi:BlaI family transcriptional regulator, penicillinase repressor